MKEVEVIRLVLEELLPDSPPKLVKYQDNVWYDILMFQSSVNNILRLMETNDIGLDDLRPDDTSMQPMIKTAVSDCWSHRVCSLQYVVDKLGSLLDGGDYHGIIRTARWEND
jgi:hypothetical protein